MLVILLTLHEFLTYFADPDKTNTQKFARQIEEEEEEPPIKKLPLEILGAIFEKLEYDDVKKLKISSKFLLNAHKLERRMIVGPTCDAYVYYHKNKELQLKIKMMVTIPWIRILPFQRTIALTKTIPLDQWNYYFKNAKCKKFCMIVEEKEIPLEILKKILCCKSIDISKYSGTSINQMTIDLLASYKPRIFKIIMNDWVFHTMNSAKTTNVLIKCLKNIDDVVEAIKFTYDSIISLFPEIYEKNENSLMKLKPNTEYYPCFFLQFSPNTDNQKIREIELFLENSLSNVYGFHVGSIVGRWNRNPKDLYMLCKVF